MVAVHYGCTLVMTVNWPIKNTKVPFNWFLVPFIHCLEALKFIKVNLWLAVTRTSHSVAGNTLHWPQLSNDHDKLFLALGSELLVHRGSQAGPVAGAFPAQLLGRKEDSVSQQGGQRAVS